MIQNPINPTLSMPLGASPGGAIVEPGIELAGTPPNVFVAEAVWNESWWQWFWWHAPTFAVIAAVVVGFPLVLKIRKIVRARQEVGKWYCVQCNHLLAEPHIRVEEKGGASWAEEDSRCPECGDRSVRGPVVGRSPGPRLAPFALPLWILGGLVFVQVFTKLSFQQQKWSGPSGTWPVAGLEPLLGPWAIHRRMPLESVQGLRYWKLDPITKKATELGMVPSSTASRNDFVSPDGKFIVTPGASADTLVLIDTRTLEERRVAFSSRGLLHWTSLYVQGYSDDASTAFIERISFQDRNDELFAVDLKSGEVKLVAAMSRKAARAAGSDSFGMFIVKTGEKGPVWVHTESISHWPAQSSEMYVRWMRDGRILEKFIDSDGQSSIVSVIPNADAVSIELRSGTTKYYSLSTGEEIERPKASAEPARPPRRLRVRMVGGGGTATLEDTEQKVVIGTIQFSSGAGAFPKRSKDGQFFVASGARKVDGPLAAWLPSAPQVDAPEIQVWDLSTIALPPATVTPVAPPAVPVSTLSEVPAAAPK